MCRELRLEQGDCVVLAHEIRFGELHLGEGADPLVFEERGNAVEPALRQGPASLQDLETLPVLLLLDRQPIELRGDCVGVGLRAFHEELMDPGIDAEEELAFLHDDPILEGIPHLDHPAADLGGDPHSTCAPHRAVAVHGHGVLAPRRRDAAHGQGDFPRRFLLGSPLKGFELQIPEKTPCQQQQDEDYLDDDPYEYDHQASPSIGFPGGLTRPRTSRDIMASFPEYEILAQRIEAASGQRHVAALGLGIADSRRVDQLGLGSGHPTGRPGEAGPGDAFRIRRQGP